MANVTVITDFTSWSCSDFVLPTLHPRSGRPIVSNAGRDPVENTPFTSMTFAMRCPDDRVFSQKRMRIVGAPQVIFSVARCATSLMIDSSAPDNVQRLPRIRERMIWDTSNGTECPWLPMRTIREPTTFASQRVSCISCSGYHIWWNAW